MPRRKRRTKRVAPAGHNTSQRHGENVANRGGMVKLREEGYSQAQIADLCGVSKRTVQRWLHR